MFAALAVVLAVPAFADWGLEEDWKAHRDRFLGPIRESLLSSCENGRGYNHHLVKSFWDPNLMEEQKRSLVEDHGWTPAAIRAMRVGQKAAMRELCPDVW